MLAIDIQDLSFAYSSQLILEHINLQVQDHEFLGLIGPNGGGKSTLLKLIIGILKPLNGSIKVLGKKPKKSRLQIGYVPQHIPFPRNFPITVEKIVIMGCLNGPFGRYRSDAKVIVKNAMSETEINCFANCRIGTLSGGQIQRVLIARTLASKPRILLLDEPTANIDIRGENEIFDLLQRLKKRMTIIVVTHDISFISSYVKRVACLNKTLVYHYTDKLTSKTINKLYGSKVRYIEHIY